MKKIIHVTIGLFALLIFGQITAFGCSCPDDPDVTLEQKVKSNLERAKAVFSGEVLQIEENSQTHIANIKIRVKEYWKNALAREIVIITDFPYGMSCGYGFKVGESYLIFARVFARDSNNNILRTDECSGNRKIEKASEELKILGKGKKTEESEL